MKLIKLMAKSQDLTVKAVYINAEQITALNSAPQGTLVQVGQLAYMVREGLDEIIKLMGATVHSPLTQGAANES